MSFIREEYAKHAFLYIITCNALYYITSPHTCMRNNVAGSMKFSDFALYNIGGAFLWILLLVGAGFFFGNIPIVQHNFSLAILGIIIISVISPRIFPNSNLFIALLCSRVVWSWR